VVAGSVTRRRHEIAVRLALGADHGKMVRLMVREGAALVLFGVVIGAPGIYLAGQALRAMLVGISPFDPVTLAVVGAALAVVGVVSCYLPARRVVGIDPARAFREG
jgi:putative ABC transport system permease protein